MSSDVTKENLKLVSITGESLIRNDDFKIDDRVRIAAIIDGLRKLVISKSDWTENDNRQDTLECHAEWDGLEITARTLRNNGVVIWDVIDVKFKPETVSKRNYNWRVQNSRLLVPFESNSTHFEVLQKVLAERDISLTGNYRLGQNVWCEKMSMKVWEQN
ncbi:hypothetical protein K9N50_04435 [bacterium]|nr:hypothetical protein [bacterium]